MLQGEGGSGGYTPNENSSEAFTNGVFSPTTTGSTAPAGNGVNSDNRDIFKSVERMLKGKCLLYFFKKFCHKFF